MAQRGGLDHHGAFCTEAMLYRGLVVNDIVCFIDKPQSGSTFSHVRISKVAYGLPMSIDALPYRRDDIANQGASGSRLELLYMGLVGETLRIVYREFQNDLIRPAFTQEVTYRLQPGQPTELAYRTVRITVLSADNNEIRYVVRRGFRP